MNYDFLAGLGTAIFIASLALFVQQCRIIILQERLRKRERMLKRRLRERERVLKLQSVETADSKRR